MEEIETKNCGEDNESENTKNNFGNENFRMYYALGPEVEQGNSIDYEGNYAEDFTQRKYKYVMPDIQEVSDDSAIHFSNEQQSRDKRDAVDVKDEELSEDSGTEYNGSSIPPDVVASANHFKVIKDEPRKMQSNVDGDFVKSLELFKKQYDQENTDFRRHQVEAYTNLEDLLDEPWEESDFAPPSKVDVVLQVGEEVRERYENMGAQSRRNMRVMQKAGLDPAQYQCGPLCNNCAIM